MISKEMYAVLSSIPRHPKQTNYQTVIKLCNLSVECLRDRLCEALYQDYGYINATHEIQKNPISLTERGVAAIEEYERTVRNEKFVEESAKSASQANVAAKISAIVSSISLLLAIASLLVAILFQ